MTGAVPLGSIPVELTGVNAETADSSDTVAGIDPVNGNAGTYGTQAIEADTVWVIPKGTYIIASSHASAFILQMKDSSSSWYGLTPFSGFIISDGINYRIRNVGSSGPVYYRKLA